MNVIRRRGWELPERMATPEHLFFNRRAFLLGGQWKESAIGYLGCGKNCSHISQADDCWLKKKPRPLSASSVVGALA